VNVLRKNLEFGFVADREDAVRLGSPLDKQLVEFRDFGKETRVVETRSESFLSEPLLVRTYVNEFWTSKQRAANSLHEISYRACFKPQLPRFFVQRLTEKGETVYDPFMGRGTTIIESALLGRVPHGCDVNPLSVVLTEPRLAPPTLNDLGGDSEKSTLLAPKKCRTTFSPFTIPKLFGKSVL